MASTAPLLEEDPRVVAARERAKRRLRRFRKGVLVTAILGVAGFWGFYVWQPYEYDFAERTPPHPLAHFDFSETGLINKTSRVLVITGHPDDESFYIGGTLEKLHLADATIAFLIGTDGDKGYYWFHDAEATGKVRRQEMLLAAKRVGATLVEFYGGPDGRLQATPQFVDWLAIRIADFKPTHILTFEPDFPPRISHRDHRRAGLAAVRAAKQSGFSGWLMLFSTVAPNTAADVTKEWVAKVDLLLIHASQFSGDRLFRVERMVENHARQSGREFGTELAEPFRAIKMLQGMPAPTR